jgi:hypothetical protein
VNGIDSVVAEKLHQSTHASRVDRTPELKHLRGEAFSTKVIAEPPDPMGRPYWQNEVAATPELVGEAEHHRLRTTGSI